MDRIQDLYDFQESIFEAFSDFLGPEFTEESSYPNGLYVNIDPKTLEVTVDTIPLPNTDNYVVHNLIGAMDIAHKYIFVR